MLRDLNTSDNHAIATAVYENKIAHLLLKDGKEVNCKYDSNNNPTLLEMSDGYSETLEYDDKGNLISCISSTGDEGIFRYDENNRIIYHKDADGLEVEYEYDQYGQKVYAKYSDGYEQWWEYHYNSLIHYEDSNGCKEIYRYDQDDNLIYYENSDGFKKWYVRDAEGDVIWFYDSRGRREHTVYYYNSSSKHIMKPSHNSVYTSADGSSEYTNPFEQWLTYDEVGNKVRYKDSNGREEQWSYTDEGKPSGYWCSEGNEWFKDYDVNGDLIHVIYISDESPNEDYEEWYEYDERGNLTNCHNSLGVRVTIHVSTVSA